MHDRTDSGQADPAATLRLRLIFGAGAMLGPGKAELLEGIRDTGSIAAAGRRMAMSYKRAWLLVEALNADFREPLVARVRGGPGGGGAELTPAGARVLALYRQLEDEAATAGAGTLARLAGMLRERPARQDD